MAESRRCSHSRTSDASGSRPRRRLWAEFEFAEDSEDLFRQGAVCGVCGKVQERDLAVTVDDDVGSQLPCVVTGGPADALAGDERPQAGRCDAGVQQPERCRAPGAECGVERVFRVGDDEGSVEGEFVTPDSCSSSGLRGDDDQPGTGFVDLGNGLRDTAEV